MFARYSTEDVVRSYFVYGVVNASCRKVLYYNPYVDNTDDAEAHGTHVSGSAAGRAVLDYGDYAKYGGSAGSAKLAFFDIGNTETQALKPPGGLDANL